jgi:hypothetical protein
LRVKGILNVSGCRGPIIAQDVHHVQHLAHPPAERQVGPPAIAAAASCSSREALPSGACGTRLPRAGTLRRRAGVAD